MTTRAVARLTALVGVIAVALVAAPAAEAEIASVLGGISCTPADDGVRECGGTDTFAKTFDDVPIDVNVVFPPAPETGPDGPYPLVMAFHGYGGSKASLSAMRRWTDQGYAAFSMSDRGFGRSCGDPEQRVSGSDALICAQKGYVHLLDTRFEVRDAQVFAGRLVDDGVIDPDRIAAAGGSYGGGLSMALAALRNRIMDTDGAYLPWESDEGTPISLAAAIPDIPWTDLAYSLVPNGGTLDYLADAPYQGRVGVPKQTFIAGLFASGNAAGYYAAPLQDPDADLTTWFARINLGEPYDEPIAQGIVDEITAHHSSYYIDHSIAPAPLLISSGWTDDLFPADEAIRFANRTRTEYPDADVSLFFLDYGHQRGQNKEADIALLRQKQDAFLAEHLADGPDFERGVTTITQTCPKAAASAGPYEAATWADVAPGEVRLASPDEQTILPLVPSDLPRGQAYDPIAGGGACATADGGAQDGAATYELDGGFTLMGSPTVIADFGLGSPTSQVAARLLDVDPSGDATLVARGLWRPSTDAASGAEVFQLHPNGWRFEAGHTAKLELLPSDPPYGRTSNLQAPVSVTGLELRLPVLEEPGSSAEVVAPAAKVVPPGSELAADFAADPTPPESPKVRRCAGEVATIIGTRKADRLRGTAGPDVFYALSGRDKIRGRGGDDLICAMGGPDTVRAGSGDDTVLTGKGNDRVFGGPGRDRIDGKLEKKRKR